MKSEIHFSRKCENMLSSKFFVLYQARYCAQEDISIVVCKDGIIKMIESLFSLTDFTSCKSFCSLPKTNRDSKLVVSSSNLYLFSECEKKTLFVKFSKNRKSLNILPSMLDERSKFCVCSFMQKLIVVGGNKKQESVNTCMTYDCKINKCIYIASMNKKRENRLVQFFKAKLLLLGGR